jgi:hypothetical protein
MSIRTLEAPLLIYDSLSVPMALVAAFGIAFWLLAKDLCFAGMGSCMIILEGVWDEHWAEDSKTDGFARAPPATGKGLDRSWLATGTRL